LSGREELEMDRPKHIIDLCRQSIEAARVVILLLFIKFHHIDFLILAWRLAKTKNSELALPHVKAVEERLAIEELLAKHLLKVMNDLPLRLGRGWLRTSLSLTRLR